MVDAIDATPSVGPIPTTDENSPLEYNAVQVTTLPPKLPYEIDHTDRIMVEEQHPVEQEHPVIVAESIARIKTHIERMIFLEYLPPSQWREALEAELSKYPETQPYRSLMENVINRAIQVNGNIRSLWTAYSRADEPSLDQTGPNAATPQATPIMASQMFEGMFGKTPTGELEVFRGAAAIRFVVDDEDFRSIVEYERNATIIESGGFSFVDRNMGIPIIVMRRSLTNSQKFGTLVHELEHAKQNIHWLNPMVPEILLDQERLEIASPSWERWSREDTHLDRLVKAEILAYATYLELFPDEIPDDQSIIIDQRIQSYFTNTNKVLIDPEGIYVPVYRDKQYLDEQQYDQYCRSVSCNIDAYTDLLSHYRGQGMSIPEAARMTINVLTQFPLQNWGAVTRLVIRRTKKTNDKGQLDDSTPAES